jgi:hypothetical protein
VIRSVEVGVPPMPRSDREAPTPLWNLSWWTARLGRWGELQAMSIVRVGLAETQNYAEGWEAIFGKGKTKSKAKAKPASASAKKPAKKNKGKGKKK